MLTQHLKIQAFQFHIHTDKVNSLKKMINYHSLLCSFHIYQHRPQCLSDSHNLNVWSLIIFKLNLSSDNLSKICGSQKREVLCSTTYLSKSKAAFSISRRSGKMGPLRSISRMLLRTFAHNQYTYITCPTQCWHEPQPHLNSTMLLGTRRVY